MSDRTPPPSGGPAEGTPEYEWLYGRRGAQPEDATTRMPAGTPPEDADRTRVLPDLPRSAHYEGPTPANQQPHRTPPPIGSGSGSGSGAGTTPTARRSGFRPRMPRFRLRWLSLLLLLWVVFMIATPLWAWNTVGKVDAFPDGERPDDQPGSTYLLVGSDSRAGLDKEGQRTDTIMLLHTGSGPNLLLSIPRDSIVDIPGHERTKINAAFAYGGAPLLVRTIEQNTGIRVDDYVEIGFDGLVNVVDAVGGIEICPKQDMDDPKAKLKIKEGCQEVDGETALAYSRSRHTSNLGDIDRARQQREVVGGISEEVVSPWTFLNPIRYWQLNMAGAESVRVSEGTGPIALGRFAWALTHVSGEDGMTCGVPISDLAVNWDPERSQQMFRRIIDDDTDSIGKQLCTPSGLPKSVTG